MLLCTLIAAIGVLTLKSRPTTDSGSPPTLEAVQETDQSSPPPRFPQQKALAKTVSAKPSAEETSLEHGISIEGRKAVMPAQKPLPELIETAEKSAPAGVYRFATPIEVDLTPENSGEWSLSGNTATWTLEVESSEAESLNFGFTRYRMPSGGELRLTSSSATENEEPYRAFTAADNEDHGQLWTPIVSGGSATITVNLPADQRDELELVLARVNHGFRGIGAIKGGDLEKIGDSSSGDCQIDTACDSSTLPSAGALIEAYEAQIRSVGAFTLYGIDACSGVMLNNARNDNTPYFLTAAHCGIHQDNAASVVVYWNFENTTCRQIGTAANGSAGDGDISNFTTGSIFCASSRLSDFCLIKLDDEIDPSYNVYYAGWDRTSANPDASVGIHHPGVAEKRFSIDEDPGTTTPRFSDQLKEDGAYIRVGNWEHGSSEGGSSGSPLFNANGHVVGQLLGGYSGCGKLRPDWYGRISASWDGEGTYWTRLSDWLDPDATGLNQVDGIEQGNTITIENLTVTESDAGTSADFIVTLNRKTNETVTVDWQNLHLNTDNADLSEISGTVTFAPGVASATISIPINGDTEEETDEFFAVQLGNPLSAILTESLAVGTIANDDFDTTPVLNGPFSISIAEGETLYYQIDATHTPQSYAISNAPAGASVNDSGLITWQNSTAGNYTIQVGATSPAGTGSGTLSVEVITNTLGEGLDNPTFTYTDTGDANWSLSTIFSNDGTDSVVSPLINNSESAGFSFTATGPDHLAFDWKISSEYNADILSVFVNGQRVDWIHGERDWAEGVVALPQASNTVEFRYEKDISEFGGLDRAFVDNLRLASTIARPFLTSRTSLSAVEGAPIGFALTTDKATDEILITGLPDGLTFDPVNQFVTGTPTQHGVFDIAILLTNAAGNTATHLEMEVARSLPEVNEELEENLYWGTYNAFDWYEEFPGVRSADIEDGEVSAIKTIVDGPATLDFSWKVDSEENADFLSLYVDGVLVSSISGQTSWTSESISLDGTSIHTVEFVYSKDFSISTGEDAGWVRSLSLDGVPQKLKFTATEGTYSKRVVLDWEVDFSFDDIWIYRAETNNPAEAVYIGRDFSSYWDYDLVGGQEYFYWALAGNEHGVSLLSDAVRGWKSGPLPAAPGNFSATDSTHTDRVDLSWTAVNTAHAYQIHRATSSSGPFVIIAETDGETLTYSDTTAVAGSTYYYAVSAVNAMGAGALSAPAVGSRQLLAPESLQLLSESVSGVTLQWSAPTGQFDSFSLLRSFTNDPATAELVSSIPSGTLQHTDTEAVPGETYYYFVRAEGSAGSSLVSDGVTATTMIMKVIDGGLVEEASSEFLSLVLVKPTANSPDFDVQTSEDLVTWNTLTESEYQQVGPAETYDSRHEKIRIRLNESTANKSKHFTRLLLHFP